MPSTAEPMEEKPVEVERSDEWYREEIAKLVKEYDVPPAVMVVMSDYDLPTQLRAIQNGQKIAVQEAMKGAPARKH